MADKSKIARPYAKAVFEIAWESETLSAWSDTLNAAASAIDTPGMHAVLISPHVSSDELVQIIADVCRQVDAFPVGDPGENLLRVLALNHRLGLLPEIAELYDSMKAEAENVVEVTLTSATPIEDPVRQRFTAALAQRLGRTIHLHCETDESLIGGAVIRANDLVIDGSLRGRLEKLAETMIN